MSVLSVIGIVVAMAALIILMSKGVPQFVSVIIATAIMIATSGMTVEETVFTYFVAGLAGFMKSYFLLFVFGALYGKLYLDGGAARKLALSVASLCGKSKKNAKYLSMWFVPIMYWIFTYVGIAGFVIMFCVYGIAKELFQVNNVPWRFYAFGGGSLFIAMILAGNLNGCNVAIANICGTTISSGFGISVVAALIYIVLLAIVMKIAINRAEKNGETFLDSGAEIAKVEAAKVDDSSLPNLILTVVPLLVVVLFASVLKMDAQLALLIGCIACIICYWKNLKPRLMPTIQMGCASGFNSICTIAAIFGMITVMKVVPGFKVIMGLMGSFSPIAKGMSLLSVMTVISCAPITAVTAFGESAFQLFTAAGLTPAVSHRLMTLTHGFCSMPWSTGVANCVTVAKVEYKKCCIVYLYGVACNLITLLIVCALASAGIFA